MGFPHELGCVRIKHLRLLACQQVLGAQRLNRPEPAGVVRAARLLQRFPPL